MTLLSCTTVNPLPVAAGETLERIGRHRVKTALLLAGLVLLTACAQAPGRAEDQHTQALPSSAVGLQAEIQELSASANSQQDVVQLIQLHEAVITDEPEALRSLAALAQLHTLMGAAYSDRKALKKHHYLTAVDYAETIMASNSAFRRDREAGQKAWEASDHLTAREASGLGWWSTAMLYYYRECSPYKMQIVNYRWVKRSKVMMDRLAQVDPGWMSGTNYFNLSIYYHAVPEVAGGDQEKSRALMAEAERFGPDRLLVPWGKAKYIHTHHGDRLAFEQSLQWILEQDVNADNGELYAWRLYFKSQALALLDDADQLF